MYRKTSKKDTTAIRIEDFFLPFGGKLNGTNKWVKWAQLIPWDDFEDLYASQMCADNGSPALPFRVAIGSLIVKEHTGLSDRDVVDYIAENPYVQYFLGYESFLETKPFDSSMMTHFRKRITDEMLTEFNDKLVGDHLEKNDQNISKNDDFDNDSDNSGTMIIDATCIPADIRYPTDLSLLNEAREKSESIIDELWTGYENKGLKPRTYRIQARKHFLKNVRKKKITTTQRRKAIRCQLGYLRRNIQTIKSIGIIDKLSPESHHQLLVITEVYRQQLELYTEQKLSIPDRIVSISQPHVRPIVRGKAGRPVEFGAKVSISLVDGFAFVDRISFDAYNESEDLKNQSEAYRTRFGVYPKKILADQIYRTRENRLFCKENGIKLSGKPLGRPPQNGYSAEEKQRWRQDECERVAVEGKFGQVKRRYSLGRVMTKLSDTTRTVITIAFFLANLKKILFVPFLRRLIMSFISFFSTSAYSIELRGQ